MGLLMTPDQIRNSITLYDKEWVNNVNTNCYAFALGLDIDEWDITPNAYQPGMMFAKTFDQPYEEVKELSFEERLLMDLELLKIDCKEANPFEKPRCTSTRVSWLISMFESETDVHFLRKNANGIWWHKQGYIFSSPTNLDQYRKLILDPRDCTIGNYEYKKTYKLSFEK